MSPHSEIENKFGALPSLYKKWISQNVPYNQEYNASDYLAWLKPSQILDKDNYEFDGETPRDELMILGLCHEDAIWFLDTKNGTVIIWILFHEATLYAPNLSGWIFRVCLDLACGFYDDGQETITTIHNLSSLIATHSPRLTEQLKTIINRPITIGEHFNSLLTEQECDSMIIKEFGQEYLNTEVEIFKP
ncbi:hypothetical protein FUAX_41490 (plasmid) [Fulvitalea axinellae]|uniref:SMI1/KNR4 family protein n=1 Tax=Fulvitalea axinellae TaxID=1182444 RepID=A0AAU9CXF5_9BACT|nr:hypothetical protein FUAX_41490 [Fulvitalea axinellae]